MKVICIDNFNRDHISDYLVCSNVSEHYGQMIVDMLNLNSGENSSDYYRVVEDDYKLYDAYE